MSIQQLERLSPLAAPLPPAPKGDVFTQSQWTTFLALADTVIPSIRISSEPSTASQISITPEDYSSVVAEYKASVQVAADEGTLSAFFTEGASSNAEFVGVLKRLVGSYLRPDALKGLAFIMTCLDTRAGCLVLTGTTTSFHRLPLTMRQTILAGWAHSALPPLRQIYKSFTFLFKNIYLKTSPHIAEALGFPRIPVHGTPAPGYPYKFIQIPAGEGPFEIETSVVIVGSGCGAGVSAANISAAGHKVLVLERGYHHQPSHYPMTELAGGIHLFENNQLLPSDDGSMNITTGCNFGGGGTVNWSASLQTQGFVRAEWARMGLPFFETQEWQACLDRVCDRMGVATEQIEHNHGNRVLLEGARRMGWTAKVVPQNTAGKKHYCGYCSLGCASCEKQGPVNSWLVDAAEADAQFAEGFEVHEVLFENNGGKKVAVGVRGTWTSRDSEGGLSGEDRIVREVIVKAKKVIMSAGTLWSPTILLRSGVKNYHLGRNLHLHPANVLLGTFPHDVRPWEGGIITSVVTEFENLDGKGHGVKLECTAMTPSFCMTFLPWGKGLDWKKEALKLRQMNGFISLTRDRDSGQVYVDPETGKPRIIYTMSEFDRGNCLQGVLALARILFISGATEILPTNIGMPAFKRTSSNVADDDASFKTWLDQIRAAGLKHPYVTIGNAHQMGTCRMGDSPKRGATDPRGRVWGTEDLYVADASLMPSASGVNPMVTTMGLAEWVSRGVVKDLAGQDVTKARL